MQLIQALLASSVEKADKEGHKALTLGERALGKFKGLIKMSEDFRSNKIEILDIDMKPILGYVNIPIHHRDPLDRLILSQAIHEGPSVVSSDQRFSKYGVEWVWQPIPSLDFFRIPMGYLPVWRLPIASALLG